MACASFAGGFVPIGTDVVVVVTASDNNQLASITTTAEAAPGSPREAVRAIAEAYGAEMKDVRATVYVVVGGADGNEV